jgi:hypothetical protein
MWRIRFRVLGNVVKIKLNESLREMSCKGYLLRIPEELCSWLRREFRIYERALG